MLSPKSIILLIVTWVHVAMGKSMTEMSETIVKNYADKAKFNFPGNSRELISNTKGH